MKVDDPLEAKRLLVSASETGARADLSFPKQDRRFISKVCMDYDEKEGLCLDLPAELDANSDIAAQGVECNGILFLRGQVLVCIRTENVKIRDRKLLLLAPWTIFKIQRRKEARYEIPMGYEHLVTIDAIEGGLRRMTKRLIDISPSGLAFQAASSREASLFRVGLMMKNITFRIEENTISVDAQVCNSVPLGPGTGLAGCKIGLKILRIKNEDSLILSGWIARNLAIVY